MHNGGWFGMGGMGFYGWAPVLVVVVLILVWAVSRRRRGDGD